MSTNESHEDWYWRSYRERNKLKRLSDDEKLVYLESLGPAREPFEEKMLARLRGEPEPEKVGRLGGPA